jgi:uncharacterized membrane protein YbaN (DUF454 family)
MASARDITPAELGLILTAFPGTMIIVLASAVFMRRENVIGMVAMLVCNECLLNLLDIY